MKKESEIRDVIYFWYSFPKLGNLADSLSPTVQKWSLNASTFSCGSVYIWPSYIILLIFACLFLYLFNIFARCFHVLLAEDAWLSKSSDKYFDSACLIHFVSLFLYSKYLQFAWSDLLVIAFLHSRFLCFTLIFKPLVIQGLSFALFLDSFRNGKLVLYISVNLLIKTSYRSFSFSKIISQSMFHAASMNYSQFLLPNILTSGLWLIRTLCRVLKRTAVGMWSLMSQYKTLGSRVVVYDALIKRWLMHVAECDVTRVGRVTTGHIW